MKGSPRACITTGSKEPLEAGKKRLTGDSARAATSDEAKLLRKEARNIKEAAGEQALGPRKEFDALIFVLCFGLIHCLAAGRVVSHGIFRGQSMNGPMGELGGSSSEPLYYDPIDVPTPGSTFLVVETDEEWSQGWRSDNLEFCLREYLRSRGDDGSDWIFRRVDETDWHTLKVWELPTTQKGDGRMLHPPTRLLACYRMENSFTRTIQISPEIGDPLGIKEIYMHTDGAGENYSYLDRSGKVRPIHLIVDGDAVEIDCDEEYRREMVEYAILDCKRERLYPYNK